MKKILISLSLTFLVISLTNAEQVTYTFDNLHRLKGEHHPDGMTIIYTYDAAGNRLSKEIAADIDGDIVFDYEDNCPFHSNPDQSDSNENTIGDACEASKGDVNNDETIDVCDVQLIVNLYLEVHPSPTDWELWAADCDNNEDINVADVQIAINKILGVY